jgi:hypothetical protein
VIRYHCSAIPPFQELFDCPSYSSINTKFCDQLQLQVASRLLCQLSGFAALLLLMGRIGMIHISGFMKMSTGVQKLLYGDTQAYTQNAR